MPPATADPDDRRAQRIAITPQGEQIVRDTHERMVAAFAAALPDWPDESPRARRPAGPLAR